MLLFLVFSVFLGKIKEAFDRDIELQNLLLDSFFSKAVQDCQVQNFKHVYTKTINNWTVILSPALVHGC